MLKVAPLAQCAEVPLPAPAGIVVHMRCRENDARGPLLPYVDEIRPARGLAPSVSPRPEPGVEPAPVRQASQLHSVWAAAPLALASGALETDAAASLAPVRRIQGA
jgi:hypothetical protein